MSSIAQSPGSSRSLTVALRFGLLLLLLFGFLVAIETMSKAIRALAESGFLGSGKDGEVLFHGVDNPFAGLALGVLFTVLVQSSSTTTATIVAVVGSGALSVEHAVPMIMGANIGTTITNTLVSLGHVRRSAEFRRAFSSATVHDFFNLMAVGVLFPLELATGALTKGASALTTLFAGSGGADYKSPIKVAVKFVHKLLMDMLEATGASGWPLATMALVLGLGLTFFCLVQVTRNMKRLIGGGIELAMNRVLGGSGVTGIGVGAGVTVAVQSSSITTSLLVPMCASGVMTLEMAVPVMLGANIGTTVTAMLASLAQDSPAALTIALVHLLFNLTAVTLIYPFPAVRRIPIRLSRRLSHLAVRNRLWVLAYVIGCFVVLPLSGWLLWGSASG